MKIFLCSAKEGIGIKELLIKIEKIPCPKTDIKTKALIFDSYFDAFEE